MNKSIYERVTNTMLELLEQNIVPWKKSWIGSLPVNFQTKIPYNGINIWLLASMQLLNGYRSNIWGTFNQFSSHNIKIKKGEKASYIVYVDKAKIKPDKDNLCLSCLKQCKKEAHVNCTEYERGNYNFLKVYNVFNLEQTTAPEQIIEIPGSLDSVQNYLKKSGVKLGIFIKPCYDPQKDCILIPERNNFQSEILFQATLNHEIIHSTGHETRLDRAGVTECAAFGSDTYSEEELIAELGQSILNSLSGIFEETKESSASYIKGWLSVFKEDKKIFMKAAGGAQKAVDLVLSYGCS